MSNNKTFDTTNIVKIYGNICINIIQSLWEYVVIQVYHNQGVPHDVVCFLHWPLKSTKNQIILLTPNNPRKATPQEEPNVIGGFQWFAKRLIKEALHHRKRFPRAKVTPFSKELPNGVSRIAPHLLSQWTIEAFVLHWLHNWGATIGATLVNLYQDSSTSFVDRHYLMND